MSAPVVTDVEGAVAILAGDGLVAFPTETVWGLAAAARSDAAVARLLAWKGRPASHPLPVLVAGRGELAALGALPGPAAERLIDAFWPGPVTLVLACRARLADGVMGGDGSVGFRCSTHPLAAALAGAAARAGLGPLTATSLNRSGEPPAATRARAAALCAGGDGPALLSGEPDAGGGPPSTVVRCTGRVARVLRAGAVAPDRVLRVAGSAA